LTGGGLGGHFWKSDADEETLTWILGKLVALSGGISFPTFPNMAWQGVVLGVIEKNKSQEKTLSGIFGKIMALLGAISFATFSNLVWQRIVLGTSFEKFGQGAKPYHPSIFPKFMLRFSP